MSERPARVIYWLPRVLGILFAAFISLFALDVFDLGYGLWETLLALLIHLVPTYLILIALAVAWRWEWIGALLFVGLTVAYTILAWGKFAWFTYLLLGGPLLLLSALFLLSWTKSQELKASP